MAIASGKEKDKIKKIEEKPMGDDDIRDYLGNIKIIKYSKLKKCRDINQLLPNDFDCAILLYENQPNNGHWCALLKYPEKNESVIEFFDPYGNTDKTILNWNRPETNHYLGIDNAYLTELFKNCPNKVIHNNFKYQEEAPDNDINTCGRHCVHRILKLMKNRLNLKSYNKYMKEMKKRSNLNYDGIVSALVNKI